MLEQRIKKVDCFMRRMYGIELLLIFQLIYVKNLIFIKQRDHLLGCVFVGCRKMIRIKNYGRMNLKFHQLLLVHLVRFVHHLICCLNINGMELVFNLILI